MRLEIGGLVLDSQPDGLRVILLLEGIAVLIPFTNDVLPVQTVTLLGFARPYLELVSATERAVTARIHPHRGLDGFIATLWRATGPLEEGFAPSLSLYGMQPTGAVR